MVFGKRLKSLREEKGFTQQDIADILGVGRATIAGYETKGKQPDYEKLMKLAEFFNTSVDYLLGRTDQRNAEEKPELPVEFETPEEAMKFILEQNVIMGFGGFDVNKMDDDEVVDFANELLNQLRILSYKYKK
ncbi:XRE family transcriptional regulator [Clostridium sp. Cult3]|nr:XRE family transcriptional regulator [Clostridium sp. Cult3]